MFTFEITPSVVQSGIETSPVYLELSLGEGSLKIFAGKCESIFKKVAWSLSELLKAFFLRE